MPTFNIPKLTLDPALASSFTSSPPKRGPGDLPEGWADPFPEDPAMPKAAARPQMPTLAIPAPIAPGFAPQPAAAGVSLPSGKKDPLPTWAIVTIGGGLLALTGLLAYFAARSR